MKLRRVLSIFFFSTSVYFSACDNAPKGDKVKISDAERSETTEGQSYLIDTTASSIRFTGHGVGKNHPGNFHLSSGYVTISDSQLSGGKFSININSIKLEQKDDMIQKKLRPHLLSGDFFDAEKFGTAQFEITKAEPYKADKTGTSVIEGANFNISGNLTLKEVTKNVTFPARIDLNESELKAKANFDIDRRQWQMNYGSDKNLGDKFISETVNINLDILAKK